MEKKTEKILVIFARLGKKFYFGGGGEHTGVFLFSLCSPLVLSPLPPFPYSSFLGKGKKEEKARSARKDE